jgi:hypothetical protein
MAMNADECRRNRLTREAMLEHDQQLLAVVNQAYRQIEKAYRNSIDYQAMVRRYPQLQRAIGRCSQADWVGGTPPWRHSDRSGVLLQWDRSHGEH